MITVNSVKTLPNFELDLTFSNGERRRFDMRPYLHYPVFRRLANPGFFSLAKVDYGTVSLGRVTSISPQRRFTMLHFCLMSIPQRYNSLCWGFNYHYPNLHCHHR